MPSGCKASGGNVTCPALSFDGDTLVFENPMTLTINGNLSISQTGINVGGSTSNLTLAVKGTLNPGYQSNINANVVAYAVDNGSSATTFGGNIQATSGVVNLGYQNTVTGSITDATGAIVLGSQVTVGGNITGGTGKITISDYSSITGSIISTTGDVSLATSVKAGGIASTSGDISVGYKGTISGAVTSTSGSITLGNEATAISIASNTGKVNVNYSAYVCGDITTNIGTILLDNEALVGGNITSSTGSITLSWMVRVRGNVTTRGTLTRDRTSTVNDTSLVIASCTVLQPPSTPPSGFNAFEQSYKTDATDGELTTKIAGRDMAVGIVALTGSPAKKNSAFTGTVTADLVDGSLAANCADRTALGVEATLPFTSSDAGRINVTLPASLAGNNAWRNVQIRMTYRPSFGTAIVACSTDRFAIRPSSLAVAVTHDDASTAGAKDHLDLGDRTKTHKAGRPFTITATAYNDDLKTISTNYDGSPAPVFTKPVACSGDACVINATFASSSPGIVVSNTAIYGEVGFVQIQLEDKVFAEIDKDEEGADWIITSNPITIGRFIPDHFTLLNGSVVTPACGGTDSFTYMNQPFEEIKFDIEAQNAGNIKTRNYKDDLAIGEVTVVAENGDAGINLRGRISLPLGNKWNEGTYSLDAKKTATFRRQTAAAEKTDAPDGPYDSLQLGVFVTDLDGPKMDTNKVNMNAAAVGCGAGCDAQRIGDVNTGTEEAPVWTAQPTKVRFGRLKLSNAHGSDRLNLPIPMRAEYWNGTTFVTNTADSCTAIANKNVALLNYKGGINTTNMPSGNLAVGSTFKKGIGSLKLLRPKSAPRSKGSVDVCVDLGADNPEVCKATSANLPWLQGRWNGSGTAYDDDPKSRATFGVFKNANEFIYIREMY